MQAKHRRVWLKAYCTGLETKVSLSPEWLWRIKSCFINQNVCLFMKYYKKINKGTTSSVFRIGSILLHSNRYYFYLWQLSAGLAVTGEGAKHSGAQPMRSIWSLNRKFGAFSRISTQISTSPVARCQIYKLSNPELEIKDGCSVYQHK